MSDSPSNAGPTPARCPVCGSPLRVMGTLPALAGLPKVTVFECPICRTITRVSEPPKRQDRDKT